MSAFIAIGWFLWILIAMYIVNVLGGLGLPGCPGGRQWWHIPAQLLGLAHLTAVVMLHPF